MELLAKAIKEGKAYHLFVEGEYVTSFFFPTSASMMVSKLRREFNITSTVQVKYLTNRRTA